MHDNQKTVPDDTAVRTALWRALHVEVDSQPHVFEDTVGLELWLRVMTGAADRT